MHDPDTQAFVIPWRYRWSTLGNKPWRYWEPLITIWHHDPQKHGSDDSCGWFTPPFSETTREIVKSLAWEEAREPFLFALDAKTNSDPLITERFVFGSIMLMSRCLVNRGVIRRPVSVSDAQRWAAEMTYNRVDSFLGTFCFKSGYHSNTYDRNIERGVQNTPEEDRHWREQQASSFYGAIAGLILRNRRLWFQKPRWHFWHWRLQIHPLQRFKRWAFSRCCKCGKRFKWGASVGINSWHSDGPSWSGEKNVYHMDCGRDNHETQQA